MTTCMKVFLSNFSESVHYLSYLTDDTCVKFAVVDILPKEDIGSVVLLSDKRFLDYVIQQLKEYSYLSQNYGLEKIQKR